MSLKKFVNEVAKAHGDDHVSALAKVSEEYGVAMPEYVVDQPNELGVYSSGKVTWLEGRERKWEALRVQHQVKSKEAVEHELAKIFWDELVNDGVPYLVLMRRGPRSSQESQSQSKPSTVLPFFHKDMVSFHKGFSDFLPRDTGCGEMVDAVGNLMLQPSTPPGDLCLHLVNLDTFKELPVHWQGAVRNRNVILFCGKTTGNPYAHLNIPVVASEGNGFGFTKHNMTFYCSTNLEMLRTWGALKIHSTRKHGAILSELLRTKGILNVLASNQTQPGRPW